MPQQSVKEYQLEKQAENLPEAANNVASLKIFLDFKYQACMSALEYLSKGVTFYFTVLAIVIGIVFSAKISAEVRHLVTIGASLISVLVFIFGLFIGHGVIAGISDINKTLRIIDPITYDRISLDRFMRRGMVSGVISLLCSLSILAVMFYILHISKDVLPELTP